MNTNLKPIRFLLKPLIFVLLLSCSTGGGSEQSDEDNSFSPPSNTLEDLEGDLSRCATQDLDEPTLSELATLFQGFSATARRFVSGKQAYQPIPVIFHVIAKGESYEDGNVSDAMIAEQVDYLNQTFSGALGGTATPFHFELAGIDRVMNPAWHTMAPGTEVEVQAKTSLHSGNANTLNLYLVNTEGGVLGFSTFPILYFALPEFDGVVINFRTLPGGTFHHYSTGKVAVHEVGHWLGLLHTFQGECDPLFGDLVTDTASEKLPEKGQFCPDSRDSCPDLDGQDPIHNHMTYTADECRSEFTPGQLDLMNFSAITFRGIT